MIFYYRFLCGANSLLLDCFNGCYGKNNAINECQIKHHLTMQTQIWTQFDVSLGGIYFNNQVIKLFKWAFLVINVSQICYYFQMQFDGLCTIEDWLIVIHIFAKNILIMIIYMHRSNPEIPLGIYKWHH